MNGHECMDAMDAWHCHGRMRWPWMHEWPWSHGWSWMHGRAPSEGGLEGEGERTPLACHLSLCMCAALCSCKISAKGGRWVAVLCCRLEGSSRREQLITSCLLPPLLHQLPINRHGPTYHKPHSPNSAQAWHLKFCPSKEPGRKGNKKNGLGSRLQRFRD